MERGKVNTYISRYGYIWVDILKSSTATSKFFCITNPIRFIVYKSDNLMKGSVHKENLSIVHNDLMLMTATEKINWVRHKSYLNRWLLPLNELQYGTPYTGLPVCSSPEFIPLYNSLNCDILHSFRFHSFLSCYILDGEGTDEEKGIIHFR